MEIQSRCPNAAGFLPLGKIHLQKNKKHVSILDASVNDRWQPHAVRQTRGVSGLDNCQPHSY